MDNMFTIGVLIGNANSPHTRDLMQGIYLAGKRLNVNTIFFLAVHNQYFYRAYFGENAEDDYDYQFNIVYDYVAYEKVDALIISYGTLTIFLDENEKTGFLNRYQGIPYVLLEDVAEGPGCSSIISDNYNGMYKLVRHLVVDHGYRNFTYLAGPKGNRDAEERMRAVRDVMTEYDVPFDESRIEYGDFSECVEPAANRLLDRYPDMEAMICANDVMANTVYHQCEKRGILVGRDIAITGYDDWDAARTMNPPLTTALQDAREMGDMAVAEALSLCKGGEGHTITVPALVRYRGSCGCAYSADNSMSRLLHDKEKYETFMQESWFLPLISRDMMNHIDNSQEFFRGSMRKLSRLGAKNSFLYIFGKPISHTSDEAWVMPDTMYLAALHEGDEIMAFPINDQPILNKGDSFSCFHPPADSFTMSVFCLYSGRYQYGILVTEIDPANMALFYLIAMQLGNALNFYYLAEQQQRTQKKLQKLLTDLNEKNEMLSFISGTDTLTGCLNRRGFLEHAVEFNTANDGLEAILFYADLDHLKEINDSFGHKEGDYALVQCVRFLEKSLPKGSFIGRLGGDEFAAICLMEKPYSVQAVLKQIHKTYSEFNAASEKNYYVELSLGYQVFSCGSTTKLTEILDQADKILYRAKSLRRKSALKRKDAC